MTTNVDWDVVKLQYELLHEDVEALAAENQISPVILNRAIRKEGWTRSTIKDVSETLNDLAHGPMDGAVVEQVQQKVQILHTLKRAALNPRVIVLEATIVSKAIEIAQAISPTDTLASKRLTDLIGIVSAMREADRAAEGGREMAGTGIQVNILNNP